MTFTQAASVQLPRTQTSSGAQLSGVTPPSGGGHEAGQQLDAAQRSVLPHVVPHAPQLLESTCVSVHVVPHVVDAPLQPHAPFAHVWAPGHRTPTQLLSTQRF
jgi:hypothetical protein